MTYIIFRVYYDVGLPFYCGTYMEEQKHSDVSEM